VDSSGAAAPRIGPGYVPAQDRQLKRGPAEETAMEDIPLRIDEKEKQ
jgi:hypothetical protein